MDSVNSVSIVGFSPDFLPSFSLLNREWIEKYFEVEKNDVAQLDSPYEQILNPGGEILFLLEDGVPVGTVAMVPHGPGCYELAKMAVSPACQGRGFGDRLMEAAISWARDRQASTILILSNTVLSPAITLYKKHGFKTVRLGSHPDYKRCDIEMELVLD